ncbi:hypothetical protein AZI85_12800 [Bdellovibrio bacteriovorus]|uniref:DUF4142 domain-containing protein n=1 Tax=Bdellovibrio bacteriovorus TaxID=959 RepID=A0A150WBK2_BDEBC|nr:DUF4142 domain-containing protein [Bdellovibrio bacteriovorus]KYG60347.1 hypothetical protein AZI85_12800 [Bdellovibrio bacteriovorus]
MNTKQCVSALLLATSFTFATAHAATYTDGEIMEIMKVANEAEIDAGDMAEDKAKNSEVKDFAKHMMEEHKKNKKEGKSVSKDAKIKMKSSAKSKELEKDAKNKLSGLKKMKDENFDKTYITQQIEMHQALLTELDSSLIPSAQDPKLKTFLEETKTHVQEHLTKAQEIQQKMGPANQTM